MDIEDKNKPQGGVLLRKVIEEYIHRPVTRLICVAFLALGPSGLLYGLLLIYGAYKSDAWHQSTGQIIASDVIEVPSGRGTHFFSEVRYAYRVAGVDYTSSKIWTSEIGASKDQVFSVAKKYKVGNVVPVFYDPTSPTLAALEPGVQSFMLPIPVLGAAVLCIGIIGLWIPRWTTRGNVLP